MIEVSKNKLDIVRFCVLISFLCANLGVLACFEPLREVLRS